jgi:uncharacterized phage-associated protein
MKNAIHRSRLRNAIVFFAKHTEACGKIKLFKLLYLLDFEHFKQTGKSVTGLNYEAWQFGPVPAELMNEWRALRADLSDAVEIVKEPQFTFVRETVKVRDGVEFNDDDFTARQMGILASLCERFMDDKSQTMIDITHEQNGAWDMIWNDGEGNHMPIPYELALSDDAPNRSSILESALEARRISPPAGEGDY